MEPIFPPCDPVPITIGAPISSSLTPSFCQKWNPEFLSNGGQCCSTVSYSHGRRRKRLRCSPKRAKKTYCDEITAEQKNYMSQVGDGRIADVLSFLTKEKGKYGDQAYCSVNNGFLAYGRPIIPSPKNRIMIQSPDRCIFFGTDPMISMIEWIGREVGQRFPSPSFSGVKLVLGDIAAPRGGCLFGRSGRRGHASHTSGQDADVGFLSAKAGVETAKKFQRSFQATDNWWMIKKIFTNPFACVKVIFLDRHHIRTLAHFAKNDKDWQEYHRFIRHMPGHKNHLHIRVGNGPGQPGCHPGARPELEEEDDSDFEELDDAFMDELKSRHGSNVNQ